MFRGDLLIDGYNLFHAAGLAKRHYGPGEFERARGRLLKLLAGQLSDRERRRTTVVFDAPAHHLGPPPPTYVDDMRVLFAGGNGDADETIEQLILQNSAPKRLHVVSSDHRLQRAARRRRAKSYDSDVFLARILRRLSRQERASQAEPREKQEGLTSASEIQAWLEAFSEGDQVANEDTFVPESRRGESPSAEPNGAPQTDEEDLGRDTSMAADELAFWENRIAELRNGRDKKP